MTRALAMLTIGLCLGITINDPGSTLRIALGAAGGASGALLWVRHRTKTETEQRLYREALVAAGYHHAKGNSDLLTAQRCALPPREP